MRFNLGRFTLLTACTVWALMIGVGLGLLWNYENGPGTASATPADWPADGCIQFDPDRATLVMLAHPHCPCTRASIGELARLMAQAQNRVTAYVFFLKPADVADDWEQTDLWQSAASIPGVNVIADDDGVEARRFGAVTSGQTVLYDNQGHLLFSGGITSSRGHSGDNAGRSAIVSLLHAGEADVAETPTFGCPLFGTNSICQGAPDDRSKQ